MEEVGRRGGANSFPFLGIVGFFCCFVLGNVGSESQVENNFSASESERDALEIDKSQVERVLSAYNPILSELLQEILTLA